jgi:hypothetical protein
VAGIKAGSAATAHAQVQAAQAQQVMRTRTHIKQYHQPKRSTCKKAEIRSGVTPATAEN